MTTLDRLQEGLHWAYSETPERILWLGDECVMKNDCQNGLVPMIERLQSRATIRTNDAGVAGQQRNHAGAVDFFAICR